MRQILYSLILASHVISLSLAHAGPQERRRQNSVFRKTTRAKGGAECSDLVKLTQLTFDFDEGADPRSVVKPEGEKVHLSQQGTPSPVKYETSFEVDGNVFVARNPHNSEDSLSGELRTHSRVLQIEISSFAPDSARSELPLVEVLKDCVSRFSGRFDTIEFRIGNAQVRGFGRKPDKNFRIYRSNSRADLPVKKLALAAGLFWKETIETRVEEKPKKRSGKGKLIGVRLLYWVGPQ